MLRSQGLNKPDKNANNKPNDKPPDYEQIMIQYDNNDKKNDNNSKGKLKYTFRALVIANKNYQRDNSSYVHSLIALKNQKIMDVVPAHDPYILKWANDSYNRLKYKYDNRELYTKDINIHDYIPINLNEFFNIGLCKIYIKLCVTHNYPIDNTYDVRRLMPRDNYFIKELLPEYYNTLKIWKTIITINRIYMDAWESNGELRKIFGDDCKPFNLNVVIIGERMNFNNNIICINSWLKSYRNIISITRNDDNLPSKEVLNDIVMKFNNLGDKYDNLLMFCINSDDIKEYVQKMETMYISNSIC